MKTNTFAMKANQLAFAIAALIGYADISELQKALVALIGKDEAFEAIMAAKDIIDATSI